LFSYEDTKAKINDPSVEIRNLSITKIIKFNSPGHNHNIVYMLNVDSECSLNKKYIAIPNCEYIIQKLPKQIIFFTTIF
jgi:hypothetical protein